MQKRYVFPPWLDGGAKGGAGIPTLAAAMAPVSTAAEAAQHEVYKRPLVESGQRTSRGATAYLRAVKP